MALAQELKVYKDMFELLMKLYDARDEFPKGYKYDLGTRLTNVALECCELIQSANSDKQNRYKILQQFAIKFDTLGLLIRVCKERKIITITQAAEFALLSGSIGKQATGWRNSSYSKPEPSLSR